MLRFLFILIMALLLGFLQSFAQPTFELSRNVYRVPYQNGILVNVTNDHISHDPPGRYDMHGFDNGESCSTNYPIVAAAEGIIRRIVDGNNQHPPDCDPNCQNFNNYIWIEHANGEWTKYTHIRQFSATGAAGLSVGDQVCPGTLLGYECEIGQASGPHLHFEVRRPNDPANVQIQMAGGFMTDAATLIPVVNSYGKHWFDDNAVMQAASVGTCPLTDIVVNFNYTLNNNGIRIFMASNNIVMTPGAAVTYGNGSNGMYHAGNSVTLAPGFTAVSGSYFHARIGTCATTGLAGGCN